MRFLILSLSLIIAAEGAALACSCIAPGTPEQARSFSREVVRGAAAIVEVDVLSGYDPRRRRAEVVRVRRTLFGRAPASFHIYRPAPPGSASCDIELSRGERRILVIYPAAASWWTRGQYRIHGLCSDSLVREPRYLAVLLEEARRRR